jgi:hypothetical protein
MVNKPIASGNFLLLRDLLLKVLRLLDLREFTSKKFGCCLFKRFKIQEVQSERAAFSRFSESGRPRVLLFFRLSPAAVCMATPLNLVVASPIIWASLPSSRGSSVEQTFSGARRQKSSNAVNWKGFKFSLAKALII